MKRESSVVAVCVIIEEDEQGLMMMMGHDDAFRLLIAPLTRNLIQY